MRYSIILAAVMAVFPAMAQFNLGGILKDKANELKDKTISRAKEKTNEHFEKQKKEFDESNFNYAISFLDNSGTFEATEKGNAFSSTISEKLLGKEEKTLEDRAYANMRNGELLMAGNKFWLAEQSLQLARVLYEQDGKTGTVNYAQTIADLGLLYQSRGRLAKAADYNERALKLREAGDNKGMLVVAMNNLAVLKKQTGMYAEAENRLNAALKEAREINDKLATALIFNNLAMTCLDMNRLSEAESHMKVSVNVAEGVLKENSSNFIKLQINLANVYRAMKKHNEAEALYLKAIAVKEKKLGQHPDLSHLKLGLAQLYMDMGRTEKVEGLLQSAYDINRKKLGENDPATVSASQALGNFYRFTDNAAKALPLLTQAREKKKSIYGEDHPSYIQALEDLALTQWLARDAAGSKASYSGVITHTLRYIDEFFNSLNDHEKTLYWEKTNARLQRYFSFAASPENALTEEMFATAIRTKGFLLNNSVKIRHMIMSGQDEALKDLFKQWLDTKENLNVAYQMSREEQAREKVNLDSLKRRSSELERELSQKSAAFKAGESRRVVQPKDIQRLLGPKEAAVEILEIDEYKNGFTGKREYSALIITSASIRLVKIGEAAAVDAAITAFREKIIGLKPENAAYGVLWKAVDTELKGTGKLYVSLDGAYHQLSIAALKDGTGKYLADKYQIQLTGNTRDLVDIKSAESKTAKPGSAFLVANPFYGKNEMVPQLPGAEKEVKNIVKQLNTLGIRNTALYGESATETKLKTVASPAILHIATHGYFLADLDKMETDRVLGVDLGAAKENPLLRCGVLLANCENVFEENYHPSAQTDNGVLTAYEAMSMDLDRTDLVVLSACETGLGSVKQGEGVYGLQRAFMVAGARSIIMSLWSVSDDATMELMSSFYGNYAKTGNRSQAFTDAIRQLKTKYKEPFYWSAFVMLNR